MQTAQFQELHNRIYQQEKNRNWAGTTVSAVGLQVDHALSEHVLFRNCILYIRSVLKATSQSLLCCSLAELHIWRTMHLVCLCWKRFQRATNTPSSDEVSAFYLTTCSTISQSTSSSLDTNISPTFLCLLSERTKPDLLTQNQKSKTQRTGITICIPKKEVNMIQCYKPFELPQRRKHFCFTFFVGFRHFYA